MPKVKVKKSEPPETTEILAEAIIKISDGMTALLDSGLNEQGVVVLLKARTGLSQRDIMAVLNGLKQLKGYYCRKGL